MKPGAPHPFTLRQLQYVVAVADAASFSRAAVECRVSQPSLSAQLAQVERAIGAQLFERDRRGVRVTAAGRAFLERARRVLLEADELLDEATRTADPLAGSLKLGVIPTVSPYLLPAATPALKRAFPSLRAWWIEERTSVLVKQLSEGALDAAVVALEAELGDVEHAVIARDAFALVTPKNHPLAKGGTVTRGDLRDEEVLLLDDGHCFRDQALSFCTRAKAHEAEFRATSLPTLAQLVAGGAGITLLPHVALATETHRAKLVVRDFESPAPARTIVLAWRRRSSIAAALTKVAAELSRAWPDRTSEGTGTTPRKYA